jgi:Zn-dependent peptidase ImmA (M78 family)
MSNAIAAVKRVYEECGITHPLDLSLETILNSKSILLKDEPMDGADGRIIMNERNAVITINSNIGFETKKRFAIAHELGHFELHKNIRKVYNDTQATFDQWYQSSFGNEETEANEFASEFLMPTPLFAKECHKKKFGPDVIDHLAKTFQVSKTATVLKFVKAGNHPVFVVCCQDNKMKWWKKSDDFYYYSLFERDAAPPTGTVAYENYKRGQGYNGNEKKQQIWKSDWFKVPEDKPDSKFYEYCLYVPSYNYSLSILWED